MLYSKTIFNLKSLYFTFKQDLYIEYNLKLVKDTVFFKASLIKKNQMIV